MRNFLAFQSKVKYWKLSILSGALMEETRNFKDSLSEVLLIAKCCLTSFWYWLPILYMAYLFLQIWMMFYIHPLTALILPTFLCIYGIWQEEKRFKARYGIVKTKRLTASHGLGQGPDLMKSFEWEVERFVDEYERLLKENPKKEEKKKRK